MYTPNQSQTQDRVDEGIVTVTPELGKASLTSLNVRVPITFDEIMEQCTFKLIDDIRTKNKDYYLQLVLESIKMVFRLTLSISVADDLTTRVWVEAKVVYEEIFDEFYKHHTLDQIKISYAYHSSPLIRSYDQTLLQLMSKSWDYLKYGISHYNNPIREIQDSIVLGKIKKLADDYSNLLSIIEPSIIHYKMLCLKQQGLETDSNFWDGIIPDEIWRQISSFRYDGRSFVDNFTDTEKETIFHHSANKFYSDLREEQPQAIAIIDEFAKKHKGDYISSDYVNSRVVDRLKAITEKIVNEMSRKPSTIYVEMNGVRIYEGDANPGQEIRLSDGISFRADLSELSDKSNS